MHLRHGDELDPLLAAEFFPFKLDDGPYMDFPREPITELAGEFGIFDEENGRAEGIRTRQADAKSILLFTIRHFIAEVMLAEDADVEGGLVLLVGFEEFLELAVLQLDEGEPIDLPLCWFV